MVKNGQSSISNTRKTTRNTRPSSIPIVTNFKGLSKPEMKLDANITAPDNSSQEFAISLSLQQELLNVFKEAFGTLIISNDLQKVIQDIKNALYERDFMRAFGMPCNLEAYTIRWSPSRALCYQAILGDLRKYFTDVFSCCNLEPSGNFINKTLSCQDLPEVICFGGGAAEVIAFAGFVRHYKYDCRENNANIGSDKIDESTSRLTLFRSNSTLKICLVDCAHWQDVVEKLNQGLINTKSRNPDVIDPDLTALLRPSDIHVNCIREDILSMSYSQLLNIVGQKIVLVTLFFTLNELYNFSVSKTTAFFLRLTDALKTGSILLIVDSPGSYSETTIGSQAKRYPIHWLLDYCLLSEVSKASSDLSGKWVKLITEESKWFRIPRALNYPLKLENMRYQIHLFRRT